MAGSTTTRRGRGARDDGVAAVLVALLVIPLVLFAALGVDVASWHSRVSFLQKSADAAAAAGSVWMPNLIKATTVAEESLAMNGIVDGVDDVTVAVTEGSTPTSLRVELTDQSAERYLSQMLSGDQVITRFAEAEYFLPLPLGSPLNYFGGDASKTNRLLTWPIPYDWTGRGLVGPYTCNVGTASAQGLGRWTSATSYNTGFTNNASQCRWTVVATTTPAAPSVQHPSNVPCNVLHAAAGVLGRWVTATADDLEPTYDSTSRYGSGTGNRQCTWAIPDTEPEDLATRAPVNAPCNVTGELADGRWVTTVYSANVVHRDGNVGQRLCEWTANLTAGTNPIVSTRSPRFWAQIHGPGGNQQSGDAYSTKCTVDTNCATPDNTLYTDASDANQGYWYVIKAPAGGGGPTTIRIFDASLTSGTSSAGTGDSAIVSGSMSFATSYRVYEQTNPLDFNARTPVTAGSAANHEGSCNWSLQQEVTFRLQWADLCTITMQPGDTYLLNVRSAAITGVANSAGRNSYAIEAVSTGPGAQPALYAYNKMVMYNNVSSGAATFYVAEVSPEYAGKTLVLELYDPGESSADAWLYPMMPSAIDTGAVVSPPTANCSFSSTRASYPRAVDLNNGGLCSIRTTEGSSPLYNGYWVTIRVTIPTTYTCTAGLNPEVSAGSCWWGIRYNFGGAATDTTTWQARVEGNPVHLTQ